MKFHSPGFSLDTDTPPTLGYLFNIPVVFSVAVVTPHDLSGKVELMSACCSGRFHTSSAPTSGLCSWKCSSVLTDEGNVPTGPISERKEMWGDGWSCHHPVINWQGPLSTHIKVQWLNLDSPNVWPWLYMARIKWITYINNKLNKFNWNYLKKNKNRGRQKERQQGTKQPGVSSLYDDLIPHPILVFWVLAHQDTTGAAWQGAVNCNRQAKVDWQEVGANMRSYWFCSRQWHHAADGEVAPCSAHRALHSRQQEAHIKAERR